MPELVRSIANRLRELVGNRRYASRFRVRLPCSIILLETRASTTLKDAREAAPHLHTLAAHTRDLSASGLALVVSAIRIGDRYLTGDGRHLDIRLELPAGALHLLARPVRYEQLDGGDSEKGYLMGTHIIEISDQDRTLLDEYLRQLKK